MINILIVEDSPVVREFLIHILNSDPQLNVIGVARNGEEAVDAVRLKKPHVITMDIHMPGMNGFDATRKIMETHPTPIVIVSGSSTREEIATTFHAMEAGALAVVARPKGIGHPEYEASARELTQTVKLMSEVKVVRRWPRGAKAAPTPVIPQPVLRKAPMMEVIVIGASTGGPVVLETILAGLPKDLPVPILIVQHMASGFIEGFAEWLGNSTGFPVHVGSHGLRPLPGHAYLAPDGVHMGVGSGGSITLSKSEPENGVRPAVSYLFRSFADAYGSNAVGVLLTGMGRDGAEELSLMRRKGCITFVQDKQSSIVHGMPGEAVKLEAATYVLTPGQIAQALSTLAGRR